MHTGLVLTLSVTAQSASALTLFPGRPMLGDTVLFAGIGFALLFPFFLAAIARGGFVHLKEQRGHPGLLEQLAEGAGPA
ncbi:hypothetical protein [Streptomyces sp900116325]|uniref:hypothetical protein n=1 Tax=Streptomyces sp. 900116325 TaxID=3154295 RepID=UPI0033C58D2D